MAPMETGAKGEGGGKNSPHTSAVRKTSPWGGDSLPLTPVAISAPNYGEEDGGRPANSPHGSEKMAPRKTGAKGREETTPLSSVV